MTPIPPEEVAARLLMVDRELEAAQQDVRDVAAAVEDAERQGVLAVAALAEFRARLAVIDGELATAQRNLHSLGEFVEEHTNE